MRGFPSKCGLSRLWAERPSILKIKRLVKIIVGNDFWEDSGTLETLLPESHELKELSSDLESSHDQYTII
jgi:hypothetical protein